MNPWLRLLGVMIVVVIAAFFLKAVPPVLVLALLIGGVAWVNFTLKGRVRTESIHQEERLLGLKREEEDPFGLTGYPLALFSRLPEPHVRNVLWGGWRGTDVKTFEVEFEATLPGGTRERRALHGAIAAVDAACPPLVVEPSAFVAVMPDRVPFAAVDLGDGAFHRTFEVRCDDEPFARALLDEDLRSWALGSGDGWGAEVSGRVALVYGPRPQRVDVVAVLEQLKGFVDRVPDAVRAGWPASPSRPEDAHAVEPGEQV